MEESPLISRVSSLDWPSASSANGGFKDENVLIQCAGRSYLSFESRLLNLREFLHSSSFYQQNPTASTTDESKGGGENCENEAGKKKEYDLLTMSERKLKKLNYYQVLQSNLPMHASADDIRRAYHKACLKYHPDKTGRGEDDEVFLLVKAAFDTLSDPVKRRSYDSTVDFDDSIPKEGVDEAHFYEVYGPVFERNLRFASFNDPARQSSKSDIAEDSGGGGGKKKGGKRSKSKKNSSSNNKFSSDRKIKKSPPFGNDDTPIEQVHQFYEFWIHFESWRDFTLKATEETEHDIEAADCREEKRWMKQEIDRKMKKMKKEEMARINLLVERAMSADPRLKREKDRERREKMELAEAKRRDDEERAEAERIEKMKKDAEEEKRRIDEESKKKNAKKIREQEKKQLRKAKQLFRKLAMTAYQSAITCDDSTGNDAVWDDLEKMNDDIELLCEKLSLIELASLSDALGGADAVEEGSGTSICKEALVEVRQCAIETAEGAERQSILAIERRNQARKEAVEKERAAKLSKSSNPWSKEELNALAKAVRKYPPGGSNRWDAIALFVNNLCKLSEPRTKEECIEKYNQVALSATPPNSSSVTTRESDNNSSNEKEAASGANGDSNGEPWTEEQDAFLQEMLRKYPADMDKNERWKLIAKGVSGRSKKECVQRFKAIRDAVRQVKT